MSLIHHKRSVNVTLRLKLHLLAKPLGRSSALNCLRQFIYFVYAGETLLIVFTAKIHLDLYRNNHLLRNGHRFKVVPVAETGADRESTSAKKRTDTSAGEITGGPVRERADISRTGRAE